MDTIPVPSSPQATTVVRPASLGDVPGLCALINDFARRQFMLSRTAGELYETIRDFVVIDDGHGGIAGCAAVHIVSAQIAELKSLAVADAGQGHGYGRLLVEASLREASILGLSRLFCLTYQVEFFTRLGFVRVDRARLPEKVWGECVRCNKFLNCDEVAMWRSCD
ncbi:MAG: N-acetyltransferase [Planctomycetota bacterium]|nr:MAG: N-acetyltransferase [Planctomycetota bacterium]